MMAQRLGGVRGCVAAIRFHVRLIVLLLAMTWALPAGVWAADQAAGGDAAALKTIDELLPTLPHSDVAGRVLDKGGEPIPGADVFLYYARGECGLRDRLAGKVTTDKEGAFRFDKALVWEPKTEKGSQSFAQKYFVVARHPDHGIEFVTILQGDKTDSITLFIIQRRMSNVTVRDPDGKPVQGAKVYLVDGQPPQSVAKKLDRNRTYLRIPMDIGLSSGVTDAEGKVRLMGFAQGVNFYVEKEGYAQGWGNGIITLFPSASVFGRVTYPDGTPAAGAAVWFNYHGQRLIWETVAVTDAQGRYEFKNVPATGFRYSSMRPEDEQGGTGTGSLKADDLRVGSTLIGKQVAFPLKPGDKISRNLTLEKACVLAGKVIDLTTGQPAPNMGMRYYVRVEESRYSDGGTLKTDAQGNFQTTIAPGSNLNIYWEDARDGSYLIDEKWQRQNYEQSYPMREQRITSDRRDLVFKVKLRPIQPLTGRVMDDKGRPAAGASIFMHPNVPAVKTDATGVFTLKTALKDTDFDLCVMSADQNLGRVVRLKAGATQADIQLQPTASYEGQVLNTENLPATDLKFYLDMWLNERAHYQVRQEPATGADGKFTVKNLVPGATYYAWWSGDNDQNRDYDYGNATIDLSKLKAGDSIKFQAMQFINTLMGQVVNDKGEPIAGAQVSFDYTPLLPQDIRMNQRGIATDKEGRFTISRLGLGELPLRISANGYKGREVRARTDEIDFKAVLKPASEPCRCDVVVVDENDQPLAGATVTLYQSAYDEKNKVTTSTRTAQTDDAGKCRFELPASAAQRYSMGMLLCNLDGRDLAIADVPANQDTDAKLVAPKSSKHWTGKVVDEKGNPVSGAKIQVNSVRTTHTANMSRYSSFHVMQEADRARLGIDATTGADGRFDLGRLTRTTGVYVQVSAPALAATYLSLNPEQSGDEDVTITLQPAAVIKGKVILKSTGQRPTEEGKFMLLLDPRGSGSTVRPKCNPDWTFSADSASPGAYGVRVYMADKTTRKYVTPSLPTIDAESGKTIELVIELEEGIPLSGKLINTKTSEPLQGVVYAQLRTGARMQAQGEVEKDGSWVLYLPCEGEYQLQYYLPNAKQAKVHGNVSVIKGTASEPIVIKADPEVE